jgi:hypothetical protein
VFSSSSLLPSLHSKSKNMANSADFLMCGITLSEHKKHSRIGCVFCFTFVFSPPPLPPRLFKKYGEFFWVVVFYLSLLLKHEKRGRIGRIDNPCLCSSLFPLRNHSQSGRFFSWPRRSLGN